MVWQRVPGCRACNRKRPTTELGSTVSWHDELMATCRAEPLTTGNIGHRLAVVRKELHKELVVSRPVTRFMISRYVDSQISTQLRASVLSLLELLFIREGAFSCSFFVVI